MSSAKFTLTISTPEGMNSRSKGKMTPEQYEAITRILGAGEMPTRWEKTPVKESLTTEQPVTLNGGVTTTDHLERGSERTRNHLVPMPLPMIARFWGATEEEARRILEGEEQPEDGPVAWGVEFKGKPYRNVRPSYERDSIAKLTEGNDGVRIAPFYPESVKAERDALRRDRAIDRIQMNSMEKLIASEQAENAELRERVKELEAKWSVVFDGHAVYLAADDNRLTPSILSSVLDGVAKAGKEAAEAAMQEGKS